MANRHDCSAYVTDHALPQPTSVPLPIRYLDVLLVVAFLPRGFAVFSSKPTRPAMGALFNRRKEAA